MNKELRKELKENLKKMCKVYQPTIETDEQFMAFEVFVKYAELHGTSQLKHTVLDEMAQNFLIALQEIASLTNEQVTCMQKNLNDNLLSFKKDRDRQGEEFEKELQDLFQKMAYKHGELMPMEVFADIAQEFLNLGLKTQVGIKKLSLNVVAVKEIQQGEDEGGSNHVH